MNCPQVMKRLSEYVDGALTDDEKKMVDQHLKTCAGCREELEILNNLKNNLNVLDNIEVPADFGMSVLRKVNEIKEQKSVTTPFAVKMLRIVFPVSVAACMIISAIFGGYVGKTLYDKSFGHASKKELRITEVYEAGSCYTLAGKFYCVVFSNLKMGGEQ